LHELDVLPPFLFFDDLDDLEQQFELGGFYLAAG